MNETYFKKTKWSFLSVFLIYLTWTIILNLSGGYPNGILDRFLDSVRLFWPTLMINSILFFSIGDKIEKNDYKKFALYFSTINLIAISINIWYIFRGAHP